MTSYGIRKTVWVALCITLLAVMAPSAWASRTYSFPDVTIEALVLEDGSMKVVEQRTVDFRGTFSGMYQWIPKTGNIEILDVVVEENGIPYQFNPGSTPGPAGTYYVKDEPDRLYVDWSFRTQDQTRTFTLRYLVHDAVRVHNDVAEVYYKFIGDEWEVPADRARVHLTLPNGDGEEDIRAWGHGPLHGEVVVQKPANVYWEVSPLPSNTFLEGRVVFPRRLVPSASNLTDRHALDDILREEEAWAARANRARHLQKSLWLLAALTLLGGLTGVYLVWRKYGKEHRLSFQGDYYRDLPGDYTPAELGILWRFGKTAAEDLTATIIDLARKGWLQIEGYEVETKSVLRRRTKVDYILRKTGNPTGSLAPHEKTLLTFLFDQVSGGNPSVTFRQIERYSRENRAHFARFWQHWTKSVKTHARRLEFFDPTTRTGRILAIVTGITLFVVGSLLLTKLPALGLALLVAGFAMFITGVVLRRRSAKGAEDFARWKAFRRFLLHFSEMDRHTIPSLVIWEHFLVYAITLGVAKEVIKQLSLVFGDLSEGSYRFGYGWYVLKGPDPASGMAGTFEALTSRMTASLQQSLRTATSSSSSGSGRGGGFSGGGGGGSGGGGGGAR